MLAPVSLYKFCELMTAGIPATVSIEGTAFVAVCGAAKITKELAAATATTPLISVCDNPLKRVGKIFFITIDTNKIKNNC